VAYDHSRFDSPGVDIAVAHVKVKEADEALDRAKERGVVVDRDELERWRDEVGANGLASLADAIDAFLRRERPTGLSRVNYEEVSYLAGIAPATSAERTKNPHAPERLDEIVGQEKAKALMARAVESCFERRWHSTTRCWSRPRAPESPLSVTR
jgi:hypothetical protein